MGDKENPTGILAIEGIERSTPLDLQRQCPIRKSNNGA
jgi:hypothetical protein